MKYNSIEEMRVALGLKPYRVHYQETETQNRLLEERQGVPPNYFAGRRTGRTTQLLLEAIYLAQDPQVTHITILEVGGLNHTKVAFLILLEQLGLAKEIIDRVTFSRATKPKSLKEFDTNFVSKPLSPQEVRIIDHYVLEELTNKEKEEQDE